MLVDFNRIEEISISKMNGGTGELSAKLYRDAYGKVILCRIHASSSIGLHSHETSDDINYVLSGTGVAVCDGKEERISEGICHICRKGSEHSIINTGEEDLILLTVVEER